MNYEILISFDNYIYANILLLRLRSEGIDCYLKDENIITIDPLLNPAIGGMKLMVNNPDMPKATRILEEVELDYLKTLPCPQCGLFTIQRIVKQTQPPDFFSRLLNSLVNGSPDSRIILYRCTNCGYKAETLPAVPQDDF